MSSVVKVLVWLVAFSALCQALPAKVPSSGWKAYHNKDYGVISVARQHKLSVYDAAYLELALRRGFPMATLDDRLQQAVRSAGGSLLPV